MNGSLLATAAITLAVFALVVADARAAAPRDVDDLVGVRASSGESALTNRGYYHRKTIRVSGNSIAYWWNPRYRACIAVTTADGRYKSIATQPQSVCDDKNSSSGSTEAPPGGFGGPTPQVTRVDNGNVAVDLGGCNVLFNPSGRVLNEGDTCTGGDMRDARDAFNRYQRDQGAPASAEAPPGGFGRPTPQVTRVDNGNVAVDLGGCNVLFNRRGGVLNQGASCSGGDVREARGAFDRYTREQGAPDSAEAPPGGFRGQAGAGTLTCESSNGRYQYCRQAIGSNARVRLIRRLPGARCDQGESWGYDADGIWVDKGCRAVFEIR